MHRSFHVTSRTPPALGGGRGCDGLQMALFRPLGYFWMTKWRSPEVNTTQEMTDVGGGWWAVEHRISSLPATLPHYHTTTLLSPGYQYRASFCHKMHTAGPCVRGPSDVREPTSAGRDMFHRQGVASNHQDSRPHSLSSNPDHTQQRAARRRPRPTKRNAACSAWRCPWRSPIQCRGGSSSISC